MCFYLERKKNTPEIPQIQQLLILILFAFSNSTATPVFMSESDLFYAKLWAMNIYLRQVTTNDF